MRPQKSPAASRPRGRPEAGALVRPPLGQPTPGTWATTNIWEVNRRRTKSENVSVEFDDDTYGETRGMFVAAAETYGTDKLWVVLKPIPIELDSSPSSPS